MRRLSMKNKRRKSESSQSSSEENGVTRTKTTDGNDEMKKVQESGEVEMPRKSPAKKRLSRGRHSLKGTTEDAVLDSKNDVKDIQDGDVEEEEENGRAGKGAMTKRRKKEDQKASTSIKGVSDNSGKEYEVEKIVGQRTIKGRRQFLVRWKGYDEDSDTWEQEKDLNCSKLIEQFLTDEAENEEEEEVEKTDKAEKSGKGMRNKSLKIEKSPKKSRNSLRKGENGNFVLYKRN